MGDLFENAPNVRDLIASADTVSNDMAERLRNLEVITELPRTVPAPYAPTTIPCPQVGSTIPTTATATSANAHVAPPIAVVVGRLISPTPPVMNPSVPILPIPASLFATPPTFAPIPGVLPSDGGTLSNNALLTSMVYHMDRLANPDVNPMPGTLDGIRRNDDIHVYVARFFDNYTVTLCPGVVGKSLALGLKALNERLRPLYDLHRIPSGFSNRFVLVPRVLLGVVAVRRTIGSLTRRIFPLVRLMISISLSHPMGGRLSLRAERLSTSKLGRRML